MKLNSLRPKTHRNRANRSKGFALVVTLSLMILLTILAVGLLSLSSISLRSTGAMAAGNVARANAKMALILALGELQKAAGPDQRITADGSILAVNGANVSNPNLVGVWKGWSPQIAENLVNNMQSPVYATQKNSAAQFVGWLTSTSDNPEELKSPSWAVGGTLSDAINLFTVRSDGFNQAGSVVGLRNDNRPVGGMAWTVVQEATKAKVNIAGPNDSDIKDSNDQIQAQARPSLENSLSFKQPSSGWNLRASKVISMAQAKLDSELWREEPPNPENADYTTQGFGLITDPVYGGFKTDLNLGFELSDSDFASTTAWGNYKNPFMGGGLRGTNLPTSAYRSQRTLFKPLTPNGNIKVDLTFTPASASFDAPAAAVPTFTTLRSFYKTPYYLYSANGGITVFERGMDNVSLAVKTTSKYLPTPFATPPGTTSQTSYRPVLDRVVFFLSLGLGADNKVRLVYSPVITLWNPYNVALEIEGAVAYPWMDMPFNASWTLTGSNAGTYNVGLSRVFGNQFINQNPSHGRTVNPYFFAAITPNGGKTIPAGQSIHFKPGEVKVFAPVDQTPTDYIANAPIAKRTIYLQPVTTANQLNIKGGLSVPMTNAAKSGEGFDKTLVAGDTARVTIAPVTNGSGKNYPFSITLEDATRPKSANPVDATRGQSVCDVQTVNFSQSAGPVTLTSTTKSFTELKVDSARIPFGIIETYHRTSKSVSKKGTTTQSADLVCTTNPRQAFVDSYLTTGSFLAGPNYETRTRLATSVADVETDNGTAAFYGATQSSGDGRTQLAFFEVPQQPVISLAAFQNADLASTAYSTSYQVGNSWASPYVQKRMAGELITNPSGGGDGDATFSRTSLPVYDYSYLINEALWDSFFFSSITPTLQIAPATGSPNIWKNLDPKSNVKTTLRDTLSDFLDDPNKYPLRNSRMKFYQGKDSLADLKKDLLKPEGCLKIAAHLQVDGAFNINSTSQKAWIAFLSGLRGAKINVSSPGSPPGSDKTGFPRFRNPMGTDSDPWMGFRSLSDGEIASLATALINQIRLRGPFQSLGEFVNRRVDASALSLKGAIQTAIDNTSINTNALKSGEVLDRSKYPSQNQSNIATPNTAVGIPGYLTQADLLQPLAPAMTVRSDTFTIRGYGEAKDASGKVIATARCEAVVQRMPEFVDESNTPETIISEVNTTNRNFGRRFAIVSFRYLSKNEVVSETET